MHVTEEIRDFKPLKEAGECRNCLCQLVFMIGCSRREKYGLAEEKGLLTVRDSQVLKVPVGEDHGVLVQGSSRGSGKSAGRSCVLQAEPDQVLSPPPVI